MTTYTGVADANGDFTVNFGGTEYTAGQKVTVTAEKSGATKSIELYAPSAVVGGGVIQFSGSLVNYPADAGSAIFTKIQNYAASAFYNIPFTGIEIYDAVTIGNDAFRSSNAPPVTFLRLLSPNLISIGNYTFSGYTSCTELIIEKVKTIGSDTFFNMNKLKNLVLPQGFESVGARAFNNLTALLSADFPASTLSFGASACFNWSSCNEITVRATTPPTITTDTFGNLKSTCVFKVPASSLDTYKTATNWSTYASRIVAI